MAGRDWDLACRLRAGEERAFEEFFAEYLPRLYRFARVRLGGDEDAAEEVAQTTLIKALAKVSTYRGEAALFTWVCAICRREIAVWFARTRKTLPSVPGRRRLGDASGAGCHRRSDGR